MALVDITIDFDLAQILGSDFDPRRTKAYVTTNVESGTLMDTTTGETRLGDEAVTIGSDGTGSFTTWATGADGNPISWQTSLVVDYPRTGQRDRKRRTFGPWTLTTADDGKNIVELEDEQAVPAEYLTTVTAELQTYSDSAGASATTAASSATSAAASATLAQTLVTSDLGTTDGQSFALVSDPNSQTGGALRDFFAGRASGAPSLNACAPTYGASPTATATANTTAIHAARDALAVFSTTGGVIVLDPGIYEHNGVELLDNIIIDGFDKHSVTLKLAAGADQHVVRAGDFDLNATGTSVSTPLGCKTGGLRNITIDGNKANQTAAKHGLAYYGIDLLLHNVEVKNCKGVGIYTESPGAAYSTTAGQNLQHSWAHVEAHDNDAGNIIYNGQSDSTLLDIVCYQTGTGAGQANFYVKSKGTGIRVIGLHCWGSSDYGIINEATTAGFHQTHVESAAIAKVWMKATTYFEGRVYEAGSNNAAPAFLLANALASYTIRSTVSACDTVVSFAGTDGGNAVIEVQAYTTNAAGILFTATPNRTSAIRASLYGSATRNFVQNALTVADSDAARYDFTSPGLGFAWFTDQARTLRQFGIEHTAAAANYLAAAGGAAGSGPNLLVRGTDTDIDIRFTPKGAGLMRFGTRTASADAPVTGYVEIKDSSGVVRKLAVID